VTSPVFSSGRLGSLTLANRCVHSATFECMARADGTVTDALVRRYGTLAKGGVGLVIPGHMYVHPRGKAFAGQTGIWDDRHLPGLRRLTDAVHAAGGCIAFQLAHGGRQAPKIVSGSAPLAPSAFGRDPASLDKPAAATESDILDIIEAFVLAARRARKAGADAIQLHCAHGYLLNAFLSPFFNRRKDRWGGSPENRFRLIRAIVAGIRSQAGNGFPILVKLNTRDHTPGPGIDASLAATYAGWLADMGIAGLEVSSGTYYSFHTVRGDVPIDELARALAWWKRPLARMIFRKQIHPCRFQPLYHLTAAETVRPALRGVPLILVGGVRRLEDMTRLIAEEKADFISLSRPLVREPFLIRRMAAGKTAAAACVSCNRCFAAVYNRLPLRCYVNGLPKKKSAGGV
jgi:2,4-dienoyl-CoA reductase-like NADH-dependent reductase (Old Yellow Enzyme family)